MFFRKFRYNNKAYIKKQNLIVIERESLKLFDNKKFILDCSFFIFLLV